MGSGPQGASPTICQADGDCPASLVCYDSSLSWIGNQSYCLCSTWYGWTLSMNPPSCDLGTNTIISIVYFCIVGAFLLYRLLVLLNTMRAFRAPDVLKKNTAMAVISIFTLGWILSAILRMALLSAEFALPELQILMPFGPAWKYSPYGLYRTRPLLVVTQVFGMLVDYQLIVVWFVVATTSSKVSRGMKSHSYPVQLALKISVACLEIAYIIGASIIIAVADFSTFLYFSIAFFALVLIGYAVAGYKLNALLMDAIQKQPAQREDNQEKLRKIASRIRFTALANACLIFLTIAAGIALAETNANFKELGFIPAGIHNFGIFVTACQIWVVTRYVRLTLRPLAPSKDSSAGGATTPLLTRLRLKPARSVPRQQACEPQVVAQQQQVRTSRTTDPAAKFSVGKPRPCEVRFEDVVYS